MKNLFRRNREEAHATEVAQSDVDASPIGMDSPTLDKRVAVYDLQKTSRDDRYEAKKELVICNAQKDESILIYDGRSPSYASAIQHAREYGAVPITVEEVINRCFEEPKDLQNLFREIYILTSDAIITSEDMHKTVLALDLDILKNLSAEYSQVRAFYEHGIRHTPLDVTLTKENGLPVQVPRTEFRKYGANGTPNEKKDLKRIKDTHKTMDFDLKEYESLVKANKSEEFKDGFLGFKKNSRTNLYEPTHQLAEDIWKFLLREKDPYEVARNIGEVTRSNQVMNIELYPYWQPSIKPIGVTKFGLDVGTYMSNTPLEKVVAIRRDGEETK